MTKTEAEDTYNNYEGTDDTYYAYLEGFIEACNMYEDKANDKKLLKGQTTIEDFCVDTIDCSGSLHEN